MTVKRGTSQACAACKYQRRRCTPDCALAPYFPADKPKMFQNAHRLFGVCNIMKILKQLRNDQKEEAMKSIIYESDMRERFPVFGCSLVILQLNEQLGQCQQELCYVNSLLSSFRNNKHCNGQIIPVSDPQYCQLGLVPCNDHIVYPNNYYPTSSTVLQYQSNSELNLLSDQVKNLNVGYLESSDDIGMTKPLWIQQNNNYYGNNNMSNNDSFAMKPQFVASQAVLPLQQEIEVVSHDYDDMPFDTFADDRQSYIESKEACESSAESPLKDTMESTIDAVSQNHELKSAAACFRLTSVN